MRKPAKPPSIDFLLENHPQRDILIVILVGHLSIEYLLVAMIQLKYSYSDKIWGWSFPAKVDKCVEGNLITNLMGKTLKSINDLRNDYAHILGHRLKFDDVFTIAVHAANAGFEFSDDTLWKDRQLSKKWYGLNGIVNELFKNVYIDLGFILLENGGPDLTC